MLSAPRCRLAACAAALLPDNEEKHYGRTQPCADGAALFALLLAAALARRGAGLSEQAGARDRVVERRRHQRHLHAHVGEELHKNWGQPLVVENRAGGAVQHRRARLRRRRRPTATPSASFRPRRLQYNRHRSTDRRLRPDEGASRRSPRLFFLHAGARGDRRSSTSSTLDELAALAKAKPKTLNYSAAAVPHRLFIEELQGGTRHRPRARAVQGRRRCGQRHADRHDADHVLRHRQSHRAICRPARSAASRSTATSARRCSPTSRPCGSSATTADLTQAVLRPLCAGRARRSAIIGQDPRRRRRDRQRSGVRANAI